MVLKGVIHIGLYIQAQPVMVLKGVKLIGDLHGDLTICPDGLERSNTHRPICTGSASNGLERSQN